MYVSFTVHQPQQPAFSIVPSRLWQWCRWLHTHCTIKVNIKTCFVILAVVFFTYLQVNFDFYTREIISQSLQQPSPSCFVVAQRKIYSLMKNGSFPRFIHSEQYKVLFDAAYKQRGLGKHWKALKIRSTGDLMQHDSQPISLQCELYLLHKDWHHVCWWCKVLHGHRPRDCCW